MRRIYVWLLFVLLVASLPLNNAHAQDDMRCFSETGYCIGGAIRAYWEHNGGLAVFGYPITGLTTETIEGTWTGPTQWFERDRLEDHSSDGVGVLAGRLGAQFLELQGRAWKPGTPLAQPDPGCRIYQQTGYQVCGLLLNYWDRNGGLMRFGYPISAAFNETIAGHVYTVQYFERRRMELHPENVAPYNVLLGLLGRNVMDQLNAACAVAVIPELQYMGRYDRNTFGCPIPGQDYQRTQGAQARFERGEMYWINLRGGRGTIFVIIYGPNNTVSYRRFDDTWSEGQPENSGLTPPQGLVEPSRGFGKIWREQPGIRDALGWALESEQGVIMNYQAFERGAIFQTMNDQYSFIRIWQFYPDGHAISIS